MKSLSRIFIWLFPLILSFSPLVAVSPMTRSVVKVESSNGSSNVHIENDSNSTTTTTTGSTGKTDISVECNGVKKEYHSDEGGNVSVECNDGEAKIETNNTNAPTSPNSPTAKITLDPTEKAEIDEKREEIKKATEEARREIEEEQENFLERIRDILSNLFKNLF